MRTTKNKAQAIEISKKSIDLQSVLDEVKFGALRIFFFAVCFLILLLDGYDVQALGAIAPAVMELWGHVRSSGAAMSVPCHLRRLFNIHGHRKLWHRANDL